MRTVTVATIFGTRPEAVKMAPIIQALQRRPDVRTRIIVTAQHRQMLDQVLTIFGLTPDRDLDLMQPGQTLPALTARVLTGITDVLSEERPDAVLVQGDTTTVMASALAAFYQQIPVGHVEAGLRTYDHYSPFPEEINRRLTTPLATWHFAPTARAAAALRLEGIPAESIHVTGNSVIDALLTVLATTTPPTWPFPTADRRLILVTAHRRENFGAPLAGLFTAMRTLIDRHPDLELVYPVHLNPQVQEPAQRILGGHDRIHLLPPQDYVSFAHLLQRATLILTDSGGIQEEAPTLGKPTLLMRQETERPEAVEAGTLRLVGTDPARLLNEAERLLNDPAAYAAMAQAANPFGDGHAAERIVTILLHDLQ